MFRFLLWVVGLMAVGAFPVWASEVPSYDELIHCYDPPFIPEDEPPCQGSGLIIRIEETSHHPDFLCSGWVQTSEGRPIQISVLKSQEASQTSTSCKTILTAFQTHVPTFFNGSWLENNQFLIETISLQESKSETQNAF